VHFVIDAICAGTACCVGCMNAVCLNVAH
jgi:hypothetical protein